MMLLQKIAMGAVALALTSSGASAADFLGSTVNYQYYYPTSGSPYGGADNGNKVVGDGIEVTNFVDGVGTIDISANNILVDFGSESNFFHEAPFNGWVLSDLTNNLAAITGVTINGATNLAGFSSSNLSWTADTISVNWQDLDFDSNSVLSLDVAFDGNNSAVPEPATWAMMLVGFGAIGFAMRRKQRQAANYNFA